MPTGAGGSGVPRLLRLPAEMRSRRGRETLTQDVLSRLRDAIVMGHIPPGAALRLEELAALLDVSVSPVREALRQLEVLGLAEHAAYRGTRVSLLTLEEMHVTYEIRGVLERLAVRRAAERFTDEDAEACLGALEELEDAYREDDGDRIIRGNTGFHLAVARAAGSAGLLRQLSAAFETSERYSASVLHSGRSDETQKIEQAGHQAIHRACVDRNPEQAEAALLEHIEVFEKLFIGRLTPDMVGEPA